LIKGEGFARGIRTVLSLHQRLCVGINELNFTRAAIGIAVCIHRTVGGVIVFTPPIIKAGKKEITALPMAQRNFLLSFAFMRPSCAVAGTAGSLVFGALALQALNVLALAIEIGLIAVDLLLLLVVGVLMALQLVTDQCPGA
jgi:hypothetical protein